MKLGVDFPAARLDAKDVDEFLVSLDQAGLELDGAVKAGFGFLQATALTMKPAGQEVSLGCDGVAVGNLIQVRCKSFPSLARSACELGLQHPVQARPGPHTFDPREKRSCLDPTAQRGRLARHLAREGLGRNAAVNGHQTRS